MAATDCFANSILRGVWACIGRVIRAPVHNHQGVTRSLRNAARLGPSSCSEKTKLRFN